MTNHEDKDLEVCDVGGFSEPGPSRKVPKYFTEDTQMYLDDDEIPVPDPMVQYCKTGIRAADNPMEEPETDDSLNEFKKKLRGIHITKEDIERVKQELFGENTDLFDEIEAAIKRGESYTIGGCPDKKYESLYSELMDSYRQAAEGKGKVRHANDEPFEQQKILTIQRWLGNSPIGGLLFQVAKKTIEASRLEPEAAIHELSGATVYLQAAKIRLRELLKEAK